MQFTEWLCGSLSLPKDRSLTRDSIRRSFQYPSITIYQLRGSFGSPFLLVLSSQASIALSREPELLLWNLEAPRFGGSLSPEMVI